MFKIRREHIDAFTRVAVQAYEDRIFVHLRKYFPDKFSAMTESELRAFIRHGIRRAANYRIVGQRDVCLYIDLMAEFGKDFDTDTSLPWAAAILKEEDEDPSEKIDRVFAFGLAWNDESYGQELHERWEEYL